MARKYPDEERKISLPPGLERAILRIVTQYTRANPISRGNLTAHCAMLGVRTTERVVREAIKQLRRQGHLIGSAAGEDGGYYMVRTRDEYEEFMRIEFGAKIYDMLETKSAMDKSAREQFGDGHQLGLGI